MDRSRATVRAACTYVHPPIVNRRATVVVLSTHTADYILGRCKSAPVRVIRRSVSLTETLAATAAAWPFIFDRQLR